MAAAAVAAVVTAAAGEKFGRLNVRELSGNGKLSFARGPRNLIAASSYARAASSAVLKVPSQTRVACFGSRISAAHFPHGRCRTPL